ncbi:MAG: hypothetical protein LR015_11055, partial [Verrucomicrobia bacterium]|nr:hypothetical protein [Verrucomicrobiota bacterium]
LMHILPSKPILRLFFIALFCCFSLGLSLKASFNPVVTYAGGGANTWFLDVKELSNGTFLIAGVSNNLNWLPAEVQVQELPAGSLPTHSGTRVSFILQISGDTQKILRAVHLPPSRAINIRWMRTTEIPGDPTGLLYISGQITGGYFIARLNGNFVDSAPDGFEWLNIVSAANGHEVYQAWDVGSDGRVVYAHGGQSSAQIGFFDPQGEPAKLEHLRASHWVSGSWQRGTGDEFPTATHSGIRLPTDNQSWNDTELFAITPDGNGGIRQGTWPIDIMLTHSFETGEPFNVINGRAYGYNGYRAEGRHWIGAVSVDRRNNHFYFGYNIKSILAPGGGQGENPDFEPAVIGYDDEGRMKWWNRLYREAADTTGDGLIDTTW